MVKAICALAFLGSKGLLSWSHPPERCGEKSGESVLDIEKYQAPPALILLTLPCNCRTGVECLPQKGGSHSGTELLSVWFSSAVSQDVPAT